MDFNFNFNFKEFFHSEAAKVGGIVLGIIAIVMILGWLAYYGYNKDSMTSKGRDVELVLTREGYDILVDRNDNYEGTYIYKNQTYKHYLNATYAALVKPNDTVIDINAGYGYRSIMIAKEMGEFGDLYCVEANPDLIRILKNNLKINDVRNSHIVESFVFSQDIDLWVEDSSKYPALIKVMSKKDLAARKNAEGLRQVKARRLDSIFPNLFSVDLIRLDTGGTELEVLLGAREILERSPEVSIVINWNADLISKYSDIKTIMREMEVLGFLFWQINSDGSNNTLRVADLLKLNNADIVLTKQAL